MPEQVKVLMASSAAPSSASNLAMPRSTHSAILPLRSSHSTALKPVQMQEVPVQTGSLYRRRRRWCVCALLWAVALLALLALTILLWRIFSADRHVLVLEGNRHDYMQRTTTEPATVPTCRPVLVEAPVAKAAGVTTKSSVGSTNAFFDIKPDSFQDRKSSSDYDDSEELDYDSILEQDEEDPLTAMENEDSDVEGAALKNNLLSDLAERAHWIAAVFRGERRVRRSVGSEQTLKSAEDQKHRFVGTLNSKQAVSKAQRGNQETVIRKVDTHVLDFQDKTKLRTRKFTNSAQQLGISNYTGKLDDYLHDELSDEEKLRQAREVFSKKALLGGAGNDTTEMPELSVLSEDSDNQTRKIPSTENSSEKEETSQFRSRAETVYGFISRLISPLNNILRGSSVNSKHVTNKLNFPFQLSNKDQSSVLKQAAGLIKHIMPQDRSVGTELHEDINPYRQKENSSVQVAAIEENRVSKNETIAENDVYVVIRKKTAIRMGKNNSVSAKVNSGMKMVTSDLASDKVSTLHQMPQSGETTKTEMAASLTEKDVRTTQPSNGERSSVLVRDEPKQQKQKSTNFATSTANPPIGERPYQQPHAGAETGVATGTLTSVSAHQLPDKRISTPMTSGLESSVISNANLTVTESITQKPSAATSGTTVEQKTFNSLHSTQEPSVSYDVDVKSTQHTIADTSQTMKQETFDSLPSTLDPLSSYASNTIRRKITSPERQTDQQLFSTVKSTAMYDTDSTHLSARLTTQLTLRSTLATGEHAFSHSTLNLKSYSSAPTQTTVLTRESETGYSTATTKKSGSAYDAISAQVAKYTPEALQAATYSPNATSEAMHTPKLSQATTRSPNPTEETVYTPISSQPETFSPNTTREAIYTPKSSQTVTYSPNATQEAMYAPKSSQTTTSPATQEVVNTVKLPQTVTYSPNATLEAMHAPKSSQNVTYSPNATQETVDIEKSQTVMYAPKSTSAILPSETPAPKTPKTASTMNELRSTEPIAQVTGQPQPLRPRYSTLNTTPYVAQPRQPYIFAFKKSHSSPTKMFWSTQPPTAKPAMPRMTVPSARFITTKPIRPCLKSWVYFRGSCYMAQKRALDWWRAEHYCKKRRAHLASVHSKDEIYFMLGMFGPKCGDAKCQYLRMFTSLHIGLQDIAKEGQYRWMDGSRVDFLNWSKNEPSNSGPPYGSATRGEDCVELRIYFGFGTMNDIRCRRKPIHPFVCKAPAFYHTIRPGDVRSGVNLNKYRQKMRLRYMRKHGKTRN